MRAKFAYIFFPARSRNNNNLFLLFSVGSCGPRFKLNDLFTVTQYRNLSSFFLPLFQLFLSLCTFFPSAVSNESKLG